MSDGVTENPCTQAPKVRRVTSAEIDTMLSNIVEEVRGPVCPYFIALRSVRRGVRRDGTKINSPRRKPLFLHLLLVTSDEPGFAAKRVWLDEVELQLEDGWATNSDFCDRGVSLVYCESFPGSVPREVLGRCQDFHGLPPCGADGAQSYLYLRLEWRKWVFSRIPEVKVN